MWLLPQDELSIPLQVPAAEFRSKLNAGLVPSKLRSLFQNGFVGEATEEHVHVRWARRFVSNDLAPQFPTLRKFLDFWSHNLDGKLHSVKVSSVDLLTPPKWRNAQDLLTLH